MMSLVAVAITVAYVYSVAIVLGLEEMAFFWKLATLLGHWIEMKSINTGAYGRFTVSEFIFENVILTYYYNARTTNPLNFIF